jgi:DNA primase
VRGIGAGTVSAPIRWDEVDDVEPAELTIATMPARFASLGDLHAGIDDVAFNLEPLLEWAERDALEEPPEPDSD